MKALHFWGRGGTNREMAAEIVDRLQGLVEGGSDLKEEAKIVKRVYRQCWGGCVGDSEDDEDDEDEDDY